MNEDEKISDAVKPLHWLTACRCDPAWTERKLHAPDCLEEYREDVVDALAAAEARGYQNAIDILLAIPSHESHVCAELLEVRRDGGSDPDGLLRCDETRGEARGREQGRREQIDKLRVEGERAFKRGGIEHGLSRHDMKGWDPYDIAADFLESTGDQL